MAAGWFGGHRGKRKGTSSQAQSQRVTSGRGGFGNRSARAEHGGRGGYTGRMRLAHTPPGTGASRSHDHFKFRIVTAQGANNAETLCSQGSIMVAATDTPGYDASMSSAWPLPNNPTVVTPTAQLKRSVYDAITSNQGNIPSTLHLGDCILRRRHQVCNVRMDGTTPGIQIEAQADPNEKYWYVPAELDRRAGNKRGRGAALWFLFASNFSTAVPLFYVWYSRQNAREVSPEDAVMGGVEEPLRTPKGFCAPSLQYGAVQSASTPVPEGFGTPSLEYLAAHSTSTLVPKSFGTRSFGHGSALSTSVSTPEGFGTPSPGYRPARSASVVTPKGFGVPTEDRTAQSAFSNTRAQGFQGIRSDPEASHANEGHGSSNWDEMMWGMKTGPRRVKLSRQYSPAFFKPINAERGQRSRQIDQDHGAPRLGVFNADWAELEGDVHPDDDGGDIEDRGSDSSLEIDPWSPAHGFSEDPTIVRRKKVEGQQKLSLLEIGIEQQKRAIVDKTKRVKRIPSNPQSPIDTPLSSRGVEIDSQAGYPTNSTAAQTLREKYPFDDSPNASPISEGEQPYSPSSIIRGAYDGPLPLVLGASSGEPHIVSSIPLVFEPFSGTTDYISSQISSSRQASAPPNTPSKALPSKFRLPAHPPYHGPRRPILPPLLPGSGAEESIRRTIAANSSDDSLVSATLMTAEQTRHFYSFNVFTVPRARGRYKDKSGGEPPILVDSSREKWLEEQRRQYLEQQKKEKERRQRPTTPAIPSPATTSSVVSQIEPATSWFQCIGNAIVPQWIWRFLSRWRAPQISRRTGSPDILPRSSPKPRRSRRSPRSHPQGDTSPNSVRCFSIGIQPSIPIKTRTSRAEGRSKRLNGATRKTIENPSRRVSDVRRPRGFVHRPGEPGPGPYSIRSDGGLYGLTLDSAHSSNSDDHEVVRVSEENPKYAGSIRTKARPETVRPRAILPSARETINTDRELQTVSMKRSVNDHVKKVFITAGRKRQIPPISRATQKSSVSTKAGIIKPVTSENTPTKVKRTVTFASEDDFESPPSNRSSSQSNRSFANSTRSLVRPNWPPTLYSPSLAGSARLDTYVRPTSQEVNTSSLPLQANIQTELPNENSKSTPSAHTMQPVQRPNIRSGFSRRLSGLVKDGMEGFMKLDEK